MHCVRVSCAAGLVGQLLRDRLCVLQMFISADHEKSNYGVCSPGPATAAPLSGVGRSQLSAHRNPPAWGFGTAKGGAGSSSNTGGTPGPGEYFA